MNTRTHHKAGITLLEVIVLMAILAVLGFFLVQNQRRRPTRLSKRIMCVNNLKQIGLATRVWAMDHGDTYPAGTALTNGGTMGHRYFSQPWVHYRPMSNELNTPWILVCPADPQMKPLRAFGSSFGSNNVSYFVGVDAEEVSPSMFLSGDRNLTTNGVRIGRGLYPLTTNNLLGWDANVHKHCGNVGLADGSVQQLTETALRSAAAWAGSTNRLAIP